MAFVVESLEPVTENWQNKLKFNRQLARLRAEWIGLTMSLCINPHPSTLLLDRRSIDLSGAQEKEGHFYYNK